MSKKKMQYWVCKLLPLNRELGFLQHFSLKTLERVQNFEYVQTEFSCVEQLP